MKHKAELLTLLLILSICTPVQGNNPNEDLDGDGWDDDSDFDDDGDGCADGWDDYPVDGSRCWYLNEDRDMDGINNQVDHFPDHYSASLDSDGDGLPDSFIWSSVDNYTESVCQLLDAYHYGGPNDDFDQDGFVNHEDPDDDGDGINDENDGCENEITLFLDYDDDGDGILDLWDFCSPGLTNWVSDNMNDIDGDGCQSNTEDSDNDNDGVLNQYDPFADNSSEWLDTDRDGIGNNADLDDDNDGWLDIDETNCGTDPMDVFSIPLDYDQDNNCDLVDLDDDNDGVMDIDDAFPMNPSESIDIDYDGIGNNADLDDDNDGWNDYDELICGSNSMVQSSVPADFDGDLICDLMDVDDDNDGYSDDNDTYPLDKNEWKDTDGDGKGDNSDLDDDGDNWTDLEELDCNTDPSNFSSVPLDTDLDEICDIVDSDDDNDGINDHVDDYPLDGNRFLYEKSENISSIVIFLVGIIFLLSIILGINYLKNTSKSDSYKEGTNNKINFPPPPNRTNKQK